MTRIRTLRRSFDPDSASADPIASWARWAATQVASPTQQAVDQLGERLRGILARCSGVDGGAWVCQVSPELGGVRVSVQLQGASSSPLNTLTLYG